MEVYMSRKRTSDQKTPETTTEAAEPQAAESAPEKPSFSERVGQKDKKPTPDPFEIVTDLDAGVRLFESKRDRQMAIKFDKKPPQSVIDKMHDARWTWQRADGIWAFPVRADSAMSTRIEAERLCQHVCQMIRQEKGIDASQDIPF
jgi:hypothetical protein